MIANDQLKIMSIELFEKKRSLDFGVIEDQ